MGEQQEKRQKKGRKGKETDSLLLRFPASNQPAITRAPPLPPDTTKTKSKKFEIKHGGGGEEGRERRCLMRYVELVSPTAAAAASNISISLSPETDCNPLPPLANLPRKPPP